MRLTDQDIRGRTVIAADGQVIGEISAIVLDTDAWRLESVQVTLRNAVADWVGARRSLLRAGNLEIPVSLVQSVGPTVVLSVSIDGLRAVLPSKSQQEAAHH